MHGNRHFISIFLMLATLMKDVLLCQSIMLHVQVSLSCVFLSAGQVVGGFWKSAPLDTGHHGSVMVVHVCMCKYNTGYSLTVHAEMDSLNYGD